MPMPSFTPVISSAAIHHTRLNNIQKEGFVTGGVFECQIRKASNPQTLHFPFPVQLKLILQIFSSSFDLLILQLLYIILY
jgi:hypothetical protein